MRWFFLARNFSLYSLSSGLALCYTDTITDIGITEMDTKIEEKERMVMRESIWLPAEITYIFPSILTKGAV